MASILQCSTGFVVDGQGLITCPETLENVDSAQLELLLVGGFDRDAFDIAFAGVIGLWVVGLTIGIIVSVLRKTRS